MLKDKLQGLKLSLDDNDTVEVFHFGSNNVSATLGTVNGPVCAPILDFKITSESSILIEGQGIEITWESIEIGANELRTIRNGKKSVYIIQ